MTITIMKFDDKLAKDVQFSKPETLSPEALEVTARKHLTGKPLEAVKEYLQSNSSFPRILGLLVYTNLGADLLGKWILAGMDANLLYKHLLQDGDAWARVNLEMTIKNKIASEEPGWEFDSKQIFSNLEITLAVPGAVEAMVQRLRLQGRVGEAIKYIRMDVLKRIVAKHPEIFSIEIKALGAKPEFSQPDGVDYIVTGLLIAYLDEGDRVAKMLRMKMD